MQRRLTKQRKIIYDAVDELKHPSAVETYEYVKTLAPNIGKATVFRNLTVLYGDGYIKKLSFPNEPSRYEILRAPHDHFVCEKCGKIFDVFKEFGAAEITLPKVGYGVVNSVSIIYSGVCNECLKNKIFI